ncbi:MAG: sugC1 [Acidimicrobiaceae bacterium]|nr:sugC1 [Acidimicrobiaceae bacterium]
MAPITLDKIKKVYPNGFEALHGLDLEVAEGEFMVLVGPSGCGKTTALRMVAGLEDITGGTLLIGDRVMNDVSPKDRDIAMVFQNYALYPHMTVAENIGFALKLRKMGKEEISRRVKAAAEVLGLTEWLDRKPGQLSGGQRQRVAMGRAIVREPSVFLMDEPLSNLDAKLRVQMRAEVLRIQRRLGVATLYVTHDQTEAMTMGDRVAVMRSGELQQCESPQALYDHPANLFVAAFIGSPAMNLFEAGLSADGNTLALGDQNLSLPASLYELRPGLRAYANRPVVVGIRPEHLIPSSEAAGLTVITSRVDLVEALGSELLVHFQIDAHRVQAEGTQEAQAEGLNLGQLDVHGEGVARVDPRTPVKAGDTFRLAVDAARFHFFDAASGQAIWG